MEDVKLPEGVLLKTARVMVTPCLKTRDVVAIMKQQEELDRQEAEDELEKIDEKIEAVQKVKTGLLASIKKISDPGVKKLLTAEVTRELLDIFKKEDDEASAEEPRGKKKKQKLSATNTRGMRPLEDYFKGRKSSVISEPVMSVILWGISTQFYTAIKLVAGVAICKFSETFLCKKMKREEEGRRKLFAEHEGLSLPGVVTCISPGQL